MQSVGSDYEFGSDLIGHGAFAIVYKGRQKSTGHPVAVKQILLKNIPAKLSSMRQKEIAILKDLRHPNIVQLFDCYETKVELYIVMEFCDGGDLADYLQVKKTLSEDSIRHLSRHIASALVFIHQHHIIHRDIKPQNILLSFPRVSGKQFKDAHIKIADFGFARYLFDADMAATMCGSPIYMAPEILIGHRYDSKVDMWSTGIILYQCLNGSTPFNASDPHSLRKQYIRNTLVPRISPGVSSLLSDLLLRLIKKSPQERMNQVEFQSHPFLKTHTTSREVLSNDNSPTLHAKSSPVPITRPNNSQNSSFSRSPKNSPHAGRLSYGSQKGFSASSGPPSIHTIVTNSSLHKYYSSPPTNVTDEGFILVGTPGVQQPQSSFSPFSLDSSVDSSSQSSSPLSSLTHHHTFLSSPHPPSDSLPVESNLSHTPPFSSLFKTSGLQRSLKSTPPQRSNYNNSPDTHTKSPSLSSSPGKKSLPSSHSGSHTKLATLVESKHEDHMIDSMDMITPSLLLESDLLRDELEKLSNPSEANEGIVFGLGLKTLPGFEEEGKESKRRFSKGLNLSQELADIRKRDVSLNQRRSSLFKVGDSFDDPDLSPSGDPGGLWAGSRRGEGNSPSSPEEMFSFQLEDDGDSPVSALQQNIILANELLRIAKTRQGPMLLLSSSMGDSGGMVDHVVRFSEQLVLCAKAATVVRDGVRQYNIANAVHSSDSLDSHNRELSEAQSLELLCLEKARTARDLYHKCLAKRRRHSLPHVNVTAEKLIFFQAADLCKQALLEEKNHRGDYLKKYRLAYLLFKLLQSDAISTSDRNTMNKYIGLIQHRQKLLTACCS